MIQTVVVVVVVVADVRHAVSRMLAADGRAMDDWAWLRREGEEKKRESGGTVGKN